MISIDDILINIYKFSNNIDIKNLRLISKHHKLFFDKYLSYKFSVHFQFNTSADIIYKFIKTNMFKHYNLIMCDINENIAVSLSNCISLQLPASIDTNFLKYFQNVKHISLEFSKITDTDVHNLMQCKQLNLSECSYLSDFAINMLRENDIFILM